MFLANPREVGLYMQRRRRDLNITQDQMAEILGYEKNTISRWENGKVTKIKKATLLKIAEILKVDLMDILTAKWETLIGE
ncbi:helix-turn-helix domain-containing protein [Pseudostreptobacillus hongkongensis]|uniref:helix-turn-helix domain-containing protein n=1 Tax=Pseudostreptobacillus hongkongensis TaxID=1162717 RepID=UPI000832112E|nr:helix-turn-helix transcriptional regulator [Pseudostreptobacillus hongkongensis]